MALKFKMDEKQVKELKKRIKEHKKKPGPLMPTLHDAQHIFSCVPLSVQKIISKELDESVSKINGVVTFYSNFTLEPKGENVISVCLGTACYVRGSQNILDTFSDILGIKAGETTVDGKFTLDATRCIGACGLAPVFTIGEEVFGLASVATAREAIKKYIK